MFLSVSLSPASSWQALTSPVKQQKQAPHQLLRMQDRNQTLPFRERRKCLAVSINSTLFTPSAWVMTRSLLQTFLLDYQEMWIVLLLIVRVRLTPALGPEIRPKTRTWRSEELQRFFFKSWVDVRAEQVPGFIHCSSW